MKKIVLIGLLGGAVMLIVGMLMSPIFQMFSPSLKGEYENPNLFRPWSDPLMMLYFLHPFLLSVILAWIWDKVKAVIVVGPDYKKGLRFGLIVWIASSIPGMLISYASFPVSLMMILSWTFSGLVELLCLGVLFSKILK